MTQTRRPLSPLWAGWSQRAGEAGGSRRLLRQLGFGYAAAMRVCLAAALVPLAVVAAPPATRGAMIPLGVAVLGWTAVLARRLPGSWSAGTGLPRRWLAADVGLVCTVVLTQPWTTPYAQIGTTGTGWAVVYAAVTMVSWQLYLPLGLSLRAGVATLLSLILTSVAAPAGLTSAFGVELIWVTSEAVMTRLLFRVLTRAATRADRDAAAVRTMWERAELTAARRAAERHYAATLHDTAASTLLMVGLGTVTRCDSWLSRQAARDLALIKGGEEVPGGQRQEATAAPTLASVLAAVLPEYPPLECRVGTVPEVALPPKVALAVQGALRESLSNVTRHAGSSVVTISATATDRLVCLEVVDQGRGFDVRQVPASRRGIAHSVVDRMRAVGGEADVSSAPGQGTRVRLTVPLVTQAAAPTPDGGELTTVALLRGLRIAVLGICAIVLLLQGTPRLLWGLGHDRIPAGQVAAYLVCLGILAAGMRLAARDRGWGSWTWPAAGVLLASTVLSWVSLSAQPGTSDWHYGLVGWLGMAILFDRSFGATAAFIAAHVTLSGALAVFVTDLDTAGLLGLANITVEIVGLQLAVVAGASVLRLLAQHAEAAQARQQRLRFREQLSTELHKDRLSRYAELDRAVAPLLSGLASGCLDPSDPAVRLRCAIEAARLRRLFAEVDEAADALLHEVQAAVDVAQRRGIPVTVERCGTIPALGVDVRRALTDPVLPVLMSAHRTARVTVSGHDEAVSVSVIADLDPDDHGSTAVQLMREQVSVDGQPESADGEPDSTRTQPVIQVTTIREGQTRWVLSRWRPR